MELYCRSEWSCAVSALSTLRWRFSHHWDGPRNVKVEKKRAGR